MWLSTAAFIIALSFLVRSLLTFGTVASFPNTLLSLFCLWITLVFLPMQIPEWVLKTFGWVVLALSAGFLVSDFVVKIFEQIKRLVVFKSRTLAKLPDDLREVCFALERLANRKIGALIVIERKQSLDSYIRAGLLFDAEVKADIIVSLFHASSPVHDGAMVLDKGRIKAVRVILPLATNSEVPMGVGTRHRSAIGITERTDALALAASEERGVMSVAYQGVLVQAPTAEKLSELIHSALKKKSIGVKTPRSDESRNQKKS